MSARHNAPTVCEYGSGARLWIGMQTAHAVIVAEEPHDRRARATVGLSPAGLRTLAAALVSAAETLEARK